MCTRSSDLARTALHVLPETNPEGPQPLPVPVLVTTNEPSGLAAQLSPARCRRGSQDSSKGYSKHPAMLLRGCQQNFFSRVSVMLCHSHVLLLLSITALCNRPSSSVHVQTYFITMHSLHAHPSAGLHAQIHSHVNSPPCTARFIDITGHPPVTRRTCCATFLVQPAQTTDTRLWLWWWRSGWPR